MASFSCGVTLMYPAPGGGAPGSCSPPEPGCGGFDPTAGAAPVSGVFNILMNSS